MSARHAQRYHALDALRAAMMLLGLVLHSAVSFGQAPYGEAWPHKDPQTSSALDLIVFLIHLFRMPVFFVVAGFFGALLMERDGVRTFVTNRVRRVLLPLALFWPAMFPAIAAGFLYANGRVAGHVDLTPWTSGAFLENASLVHFWFLWDLVLFYAVAIALVPIVSRLGTPWRVRIDAAAGALMSGAGGVIAMSAITTLTLLPMQVPALDTSFSLVPPLRVLVAYGVFFAFGWLLYRRRDCLQTFRTRWKWAMTAGALASVAYLALAISQGPRTTFPWPVHLAGSVIGAVAMWTLIHGVIGLFVSRFEAPRPLVRYLSDASYWMYIVHLPVVIAVPGVLAPSALPAVAKFLITLAATTTVTLLTYHYFVRSTAIGALLNGRRYHRSLPPAETEGRPEPVVA